MPTDGAEIVILVKTAQQALEALTTRVASMEGKMETDRLDMREVRTQFKQLSEVARRLESTVISGNGREPLTTVVSRLSREVSDVSTALVDLKASVDTAAAEQRKFDRDLRLKVFPALIASATSIVVALLAWFLK